MTRLLHAAESLAGGHAVFFSDHRRRAKKRAREIIYTRGKGRKTRLYKDLVGITRKTLGYIMFALNGVLGPNPNYTHNLTLFVINRAMAAGSGRPGLPSRWHSRLNQSRS